MGGIWCSTTGNSPLTRCTTLSAVVIARALEELRPLWIDQAIVADHNTGAELCGIPAVVRNAFSVRIARASWRTRLQLTATIGLQAIVARHVGHRLRAGAAPTIPRGATTPRRIASPTAACIAGASRSRPSVTAATASRRATTAARVAGATRRRATVTPRRTIRSAAVAASVPRATVATRGTSRAAISRPLAVAVEVEQAARQPDDQGQQSPGFQIHRHQCPARSQPTSLPRGCKAGVFTDG